jgi:hypothetical protein
MLRQLPGWAAHPPTLPACLPALWLVQEAKSIGDEFLQLEKYVNLNYMGPLLSDIHLPACLMPLPACWHLISWLSLLPAVLTAVPPAALAAVLPAVLTAVPPAVLPTVLRRYVNLNYMGFHKILKKHDKMLPHSPCRQFYISHLHNQPWVQVGCAACGAARRGGCACDRVGLAARRAPGPGLAAELASHHTLRPQHAPPVCHSP